MKFWTRVEAWAVGPEEQGGKRIRLWRTSVLAFWALLCGATAWSLLSSASVGADLGHYQAWSRALVSGDFFQLRSRVASPMGLPLSVHSVGPGMLLAVGRVWFGELHLKLRPDYLLFGLLVPCAWWALLRLMLRLTNGNLAIAALVTALGFVATHLGFYSGAYSSELPSFFALSVLYYFALGSARIGVFEALVIGVASGLAVVIRAQLLLYVALPWLAAAYRVHARLGLSWRSALLLLLAAVPCCVSLIEAAYVNRWMTGSLTRTPYQFGDAEWQSVDWLDTHFTAVVLHPRHGLLAYHPLYALGFGCVVYLIVTTRDWRERVLAGAALGIVLLHLWLQAAWFCWWLGTSTFGMRGMMTIAVLLLPALAVVLHRRQRAGQIIWPILAACGACSAWSGLLYYQGHTNFNHWSELLDAQRVTLKQPLVFLPSAVATAAALGLWLASRRRTGIIAAAAALVAVAVAAAGSRWPELQRLAKPEALLTSAAAYLAAAVALIVICAFGALRFQRRAQPVWRASELVVGLFVLAIFASAALEFQRLAVKTEAFLRAPTPKRGFRVKSAVLWDEIYASYKEYQLIPGFGDSKARFWSYLERHRDEWAFARERDAPRPLRRTRQVRAEPRPAARP